MMKSMNQKTFEGLRDGIKSGSRTAFKQARKHARRVEFRTPWLYRKPIASSLGPKAWVVGIMLCSSVLALIGGILYFRKRKQVAERYTMGEPESQEAWELRGRTESPAPSSP